MGLLGQGKSHQEVILNFIRTFHKHKTDQLHGTYSLYLNSFILNTQVRLAGNPTIGAHHALNFKTQQAHCGIESLFD